MLEQEIGSRLREGDLLSRYYEPKNVAKRPKNPKVLVSKSLHEGFATHFFVDRLWFKLETKTARGNYADIYIIGKLQGESREFVWFKNQKKMYTSSEPKNIRTAKKSPESGHMSNPW